MRLPAGVLGAAFAVTLATCAAAAADPIDSWPYPDFVLPGYSVGDLTQNGPFIQGVMTYNAFSESGEYATRYSAFQLPLLVYDIHQEVSSNSDAFPPIGTTIEEFYLFNNPDFLGNTYIDDPAAGFADQFTVLSAQNTFVYDDAGIEDVLTALGHSVTLLDLPAP